MFLVMDLKNIINKNLNKIVVENLKLNIWKNQNFMVLNIIKDKC